MPYSVRTIASRSHGSIICEERKWYATTRRVLEKTFGRILVYSLYRERIVGDFKETQVGKVIPRVGHVRR